MRFIAGPTARQRAYATLCGSFQGSFGLLLARKESTSHETEAEQGRQRVSRAPNRRDLKRRDALISSLRQTEPTLRKLFLYLFLLALSPAVMCAQQYDLVLEGGRVMDPETGTDAVRNVGIRNGTIVRPMC
jgi:hypothetical protein